MRETLLALNFFFINCVCVFSTVLETPKNLAVYVGQRTSLKCETSNGSEVREWIFHNGTSGGVKFYSNWITVSVPSAESGYGVDVDSHGSGEFYINNTQMENAGKYACVTDSKTTTGIPRIRHHYAELIVLETEPLCTETKHDDGRIFEAECSVNFSGRWAPKMEWTYNKDIVITKPHNTTSNTRVNSRVDAVIIANTFTISCTIRFDNWSGSSGVVEDGLTATNVPDYVYVWKANAVSDATGAIGTTHNSSVTSDAKYSTSGGPLDNMTLYIVVALAFALILLTVVTLFFVCRRKKRKSRSQEETSEKDDEEMKSKDRVESGVYDTIEYDAIGYEMPDHVFSHDGLNRSYDVPFKDRVPSGYENPDKELNANDYLSLKDRVPSGHEDPDKAVNSDDDELVLLSSQYITTTSDPDKETTLTSDRLSHDPDNKYTPLTDDGKRKSEKNLSEEKERSSYLEIVGDEDEMKTTRESGINRKSSSSEGSEEKNKAPATNANYTQLMPESGYTHLVL